jgi:GNAT superfamily N-acetyltransferase
MPTSILTDRSPAALAAAVSANLNALNRNLGRSPHAAVLERSNFYRWRTQVPHPYFNGVIVSAPPDATSRERVREALAYFRAEGVAATTWWLEPDVPAASWVPLLFEHGLTLDEQLPGMAVVLDDLKGGPGAGTPAPDGAAFLGALDIRTVDDRATLRLWAETFITAYELPPSWVGPVFDLYDSLQGPDAPLRSYLACLDGEPVAASSVFYGAGVAGVYDVATLPSARGRGLGAAVTLRPLIDARARGYRVGVLQSSAMGLRVYERLGFRTVRQVEHFVWKRSPEA